MKLIFFATMLISTNAQAFKAVPDVKCSWINTWSSHWFRSWLHNSERNDAL